MSRRNGIGSSLDLLLDIVCNSFGSIMFVAILLSVMISVRELRKPEPVPDRRERIAELRRQLDELRTELADIMKSTEERAELLKTLEADPRLRLIREIALLEQMHAERVLQLELTKRKLDLAQGELKDLELRMRKAVAEREKTERELKEKLAALEERKKKMAELEERLNSADAKKLFFMTVVSRDDIPYFIFVDDGKVWPVGPEINGDSYIPNAAVTFQVKGDRYVCEPVAGRGIAVFSGDALSPEFESFMTSLPPGRVPEFVISRSDAEVFSRLRGILKKRKLFHGFRVQPSDRDFFEFQYVDRKRGTYEY